MSQGYSNPKVGRFLRHGVFRGMHTGATWRIQINHLCVAAMQPCQVTLTAC